MSKTEHPLSDFRNFLYLGWRFLGLPEPTPLQYQAAHFLQHGPRRQVLMAYRGMGKSWITAMFVLWLLKMRPDLNILVVSASQHRADEFSQFCHRLIMEWPLLSELRPREGQKWSAVAFDVGPAGIKHQPSVKSAGITGMITGSRADVIIADDIEVPNNSGTQVQREKLSERIKEFSAIIKPGGKIKFLGTPQTEQSIYNLLPERGYTIRIIPAEYPDQKRIAAWGDRLDPAIRKAVDEDPSLVGKPTDPKRFNEFELAERKAEYGRAGYALQFMLDTSLSDLEKYPLRLSDLCVMSLNPDTGPERVVWGASPELAWNDLPTVGLNNDRYHRPIPQTDIRWVPYEGAVMTIDPSGRGKDETAYCVVKCIGSTLFLVAAGGFLGGFEEGNLEHLAKIAAEHKVNYIQIEENFGDGMFTQLFKPILRKFYTNATVEEIKHSQQKERRICDTLEPVMNQHRLVVDKKVVEQDYESTLDRPAEKQNQYRLFWQMTRIIREKGALPTDDRLDALAMAVAFWVDRLALSVEQTVERRRDRELDEELRNWYKNSVGFAPQGGPRRRNWSGLARQAPRNPHKRARRSRRKRPPHLP